jgi:hypothetical protein
VSDFVRYYAEGYIYARDRNGNPIKGNIAKVKRGRGIVKDTPGLDGAIFRQCTYLTQCDAMKIKTYDL